MCCLYSVQFWVMIVHEPTGFVVSCMCHNLNIIKLVHVIVVLVNLCILDPKRPWFHPERKVMP